MKFGLFVGVMKRYIINTEDESDLSGEYFRHFYNVTENIFEAMEKQKINEKCSENNK